ncbi:MAG TPA: hypothetical protein VIM02_07185 [Rhizomicrobium sp.]|jgi:hypothetical protein
MNSIRHHEEHGAREGISTSIADGAKWAAGIVIGAVLLGLGNFIWEQLRPQSFLVSIIVEDENHKALPNASIWLFGVSEVSDKKTSALGLATFEVPHKYIGQTVNLDMTLDGYTAPNSKITLQKNLPTQSIILKKIPIPVVAAVAAPVGPTTTPTQVEPAVVRETKTYALGPLPSGDGARFSTEYTLCSDAAPPDWTIEESSFVLTGDRQCNAWSTCRLTTQTATKVCWTFSMQGHNEQMGPFGIGGSGVQFSTGVLSVVWKHS